MPKQKINNRLAEHQKKTKNCGRKGHILKRTDRVLDLDYLRDYSWFLHSPAHFSQVEAHLCMIISLIQKLLHKKTCYSLSSFKTGYFKVQILESGILTHRKSISVFNISHLWTSFPPDTRIFDKYCKCLQVTHIFGWRFQGFPSECDELSRWCPDSHSAESLNDNN